MDNDINTTMDPNGDDNKADGNGNGDEAEKHNKKTKKKNPN